MCLFGGNIVSERNPPEKKSDCVCGKQSIIPEQRKRNNPQHNTHKHNKEKRKQRKEQ